MREIEMSGKTIDEAVKSALEKLGLTKDKVDVEVLEEGNKGIFNFLGKKDAKVLVKEKFNYADQIRAFLNSIFKSMNIDVNINIEEKEDNVIKVNLDGENMGIIIGYRGETLNSLQYLVSLVINKNADVHKRVIIDAENYRSKREETLKRLALRVASNVKNTGKCIKLEPMNPYERRIIHSTLQDDDEIKTYSEGNEPYRRVIINLNKEKA